MLSMPLVSIAAEYQVHAIIVNILIVLPISLKMFILNLLKNVQFKSP